ncbi:MAG: hypothetical protein KHX08_07115 [Clostridiales bacterium]|nr:hypothetical protein [Clostridiales bacterium]
MAEKRKSVYNPEAQKRWNEKNKARRSYISKRGTARSFIRKNATDEDLAELKELIALREACYPQKLDNDNSPMKE